METINLREQIIHPSFSIVYEGLRKRQQRFPILRNDAIVHGQNLFYALASKRYLDHRNSSHLCRLILSICLLQRRLQRAYISSPNSRHISIHWIPTRLVFPFTNKSVMGCLIGFSLTDNYELFDEENVLLVLQKNHPEITFVRESSYSHTLPNKNLRILYFEVEKTDLSLFSLKERRGLRSNLEKEIRGSFQKLVPAIFMRRNEEEVYKTILTLSREIHSTEDIPQVWISFEEQSKEEVVFLVTVVYVSCPQLPLGDKRLHKECTLVPERHITVRHLDGQPVEAQVFRLHIVRSVALIRSDSSLDFYASRRRVTSYLGMTVGTFRDFNGGTLLKQSELLDSFKNHFPDTSQAEVELMETFFYAITPLEKQALLRCETILQLFAHFTDIRNRKLDLKTPYIFEIHKSPTDTYLAFKGCSTWKAMLSETLENRWDLTYSLFDIPEGLFLHAVLSNTQAVDEWIELLKCRLDEHHKSMKKQILRIGLEHPLMSLDPRVGGVPHSKHVFQMLFEGLTRTNKNGKIENGVAKAIEVSADFRTYVFSLRSALWNDGSPITAYDFEYAWKGILAPDSISAYSNLLYPIRNAREANEGKVPLSAVGIYLVDALTLKVELVNPTPYFLELTAQPPLYPVRQRIDQTHPQWSYQAGKNYLCNGPYQLDINDFNHQSYRLVKNPCYWKADKCTLNEIWLIQTNAHQALEAYQRQELDWIGNPFGNWYPEYVQKDHETTTEDTSVCWLVFNTRSPPFHNIKIRQAVAHAIHREALIAHAFMPLKPACSLFQDSFVQHDVALAQRLLQEGLDELGMTISDLQPWHLSFVEGGVREQVSAHLQQQLRDFLELECHLYPLPQGTLLSRLTNGSIPLGLVNWIPRTQDPFPTLNGFRDANEQANLSKWEDFHFQKWLHLAEQEACLSMRRHYLAQAEKVLSDATPIIPLYHQPDQALLREAFSPQSTQRSQRRD